jgi:biopolymer transport protein ExbD
MSFARPRRPDPVLDITPMIDIVFQLVLFFMVSTTFVSAPAIQVDLPRANTEVVLSEQDDVSLWITKDGAVFVGDDAVTLEQLNARLQSAAKKDPNTLVVVKADAGVPHGRVVTVMDLARSIGLTRLAIATEANEESEGEAP